MTRPPLLNLSALLHASALLLVLALLQGCQSGVPGQPPEPLAPDPKTKPEVEDWLESRHRLCQASATQQRARLDTLARRARETSDDEKIERVLLASCEPDITPGLLREALNDLPDNGERTLAEQSLVQLIRDLARSYRILEDRNRELAAQLEATINGIRDIETEIDSMQLKGEAP